MFAKKIKTTWNNIPHNSRLPNKCVVLTRKKKATTKQLTNNQQKKGTRRTKQKFKLWTQTVNCVSHGNRLLAPANGHKQINNPAEPFMGCGVHTMLPNSSKSYFIKSAFYFQHELNIQKKRHTTKMKSNDQKTKKKKRKNQKPGAHWTRKQFEMQ